MIAPLSWLKEYVQISLSAEQLQEKLFSCGFEVEELTYLGKQVERVVVGRVLSVKKHPDADRLTVCSVDCGEYGVKQICTAATNVFAGALVPCALDGATVLHEGGVQKIKTGKLRGELSEGMFCSGEELGINDDFYPGAEFDGILILEEGTPVGADIRPVVGIDDWLFDIAVTANRPDCQCMLGIAREVAAVLHQPLRMPDMHYQVCETSVAIPVEVRDSALCPRYMGHYVDRVRIGASPQWLRRRLALCGLRSVNNMVDITNYVLLEMGQPMHAFDRSYLHGDRIIVRRAEEGERIVTLDKKQFTLNQEHLLICDAERGVALAGIMGGLDSEIRPHTKEVFLEAAKFARDNVRRTSRALGQRSDSSARFEKGVDSYTTALALDRALHLVQELDCGRVTGYRADVCACAPAAKTITTSVSELNGLLGIQVPKEEICAILTRLMFGVREEEGALTVSVPAWREDVDGWPDLAEEVIRMYGYDHVGATFLQNAAVTRGGLTAEQRQQQRLQAVLVREGFFEACTYSFYAPSDFDLFRLPADAPERNAIVLRNPIGENLSVMRTFLMPSMLANIVRNVRRGNTEGRLFELANVYLAEQLPLQQLPTERKTLSLGLWGEGDFFDLKGAVEAIAEAFSLKLSFERAERPYLHPGATAAVKLGERTVGCIGELHPAIAESLALEKRVYLGELDYAALSRKFAADVCYRGMPKYESVRRDLAVVVEEKVTCAELETCIRRSCKAVTKTELFDVYRSAVTLGAGKKSMAFRLAFTPDDKGPLTPEAVDKLFGRIVENLKRVLGAELR